MIQEQPTVKVTIVAMRGANAHSQMDEKSPKTATYQNGDVIWGYEVRTSGEGIVHVRVTPIGTLATKMQWIRCWEKDNTNPLVGITYIDNPESATIELADQVGELSASIRLVATVFGKWVDWMMTSAMTTKKL